MPPLPPHVYDDPKVQTVLLILIFALLLWNTASNINLRERMVRAETILRNHFNHRFAKLKERFGIEWDDDLDEEEGWDK